MLKIGFHGLGRIGRGILRHCVRHPRIQIAAINELNPDVENLAYGLNYDSVYGPAPERFTAQGGALWVNERRIPVFNQPDVSAVAWPQLDVVIDASGGIDNLPRFRAMVSAKRISWAFTTTLAPEADLVLTLGCNESALRPDRHRVISCNTCDATALAPVIKALDDRVGIEGVTAAILHPWLSHQSLVDGRPPESAGKHYELGRAAYGNIIAKRTSAVAAIRAVLPQFADRSLSAISYRVPTPIVACADLGLRFRRATDRDELVAVLRAFQEGSSWRIVELNRDPLVSSDFKGNPYSAIVEERLLSVERGRLARLCVWYDNEAGYAARVMDQVLLCASGSPA